MGSIAEQNQRTKISRYCPFKSITYIYILRAIPLLAHLRPVRQSIQVNVALTQAELLSDFRTHSPLACKHKCSIQSCLLVTLICNCFVVILPGVWPENVVPSHVLCFCIFGISD
jgi:hypothetical protein